MQFVEFCSTTTRCNLFPLACQNLSLLCFLSKRLDLELQLTTEVVDLSNTMNGCESPKRSLLYKRNDDLRQEMFAIHFINSCDSILKSCGLNLKLLTFGCIPVGKRRGFIEWVPGSVPLSQICRQPIVGSLLAGRRKEATSSSTSANEGDDPLSAVAKAGLTKYESLFRLADEEAMRSGRRRSPSARNPIREFLRSVAYHPEHPYMIRKDVMDTYIKSCAGYCVITYLLVSSLAGLPLSSIIQLLTVLRLFSVYH
jgi:Phosphatidylinositol 3- and 4-kinase